MQYRNLGRSGLKVSTVSLGSWLTFGKNVDQETAGSCIRAALDSGVNLFDTADIYGHGAAERALGQALGGEKREHLVLATKVYWAMSEDANDRGLSRKHITESCHASLERLNTDYIDLYQCHRHDEETPLDETVATMGDLIRRGDVLYWGTSQWPANAVRKACQIADDLGIPQPISEQPKYHLLERSIEERLQPTCEDCGVGILCYSPLAQGLLTGKYSMDSIPAGTRATLDDDGEWIRALFTSDNFERVERLRAVATEAELSLPQLALAWCLQLEGVASVITGATHPDQVAANVQAADVEFSSSLQRAVEEALALETADE